MDWKARHFDKHRFDNYTDWLDRETRKRNRTQGQHIGFLGDALFLLDPFQPFRTSNSKSSSKSNRSKQMEIKKVVGFKDSQMI